MKTESISSRIRLVIDFYGMNKSTFSKKIDTSPSTINSMYEKNTNPSVDTLLKIINVFTDIDPLWLLLGTGEMIKNKTDHKSNYDEKLNIESLNKIVSLHEENKQLISENSSLKQIVLDLENRLDIFARKKIG